MPLTAFAVAPKAPSDDVCPVNMDITRDEAEALNRFNNKMRSGLARYYATDKFQAQLNDIIENSWPSEQVLEISPTFMEKALNLVDQHYLIDSIQRTIGIESPEWEEFHRVMRNVTTFENLTGNKHGMFTKKTQKLIEAVKKASSSRMNKVTRDKQEQETIKARTIVRIADMFIYLERWSEINREISRLRAQGVGKQLLLTAMTVTGTGLLIASTVYAGPILAAAGAAGASLSSDIVIASLLARLAQVAAGASVGAVGGPASVLMVDSGRSLLNAGRYSKNNHTVYACEIDKQFSQWKKRGINPYLKGMLIGGGIGVFLGPLTATQVTARLTLTATGLGVGLVEAHILKGLSYNALEAIAEYRLAMEAFEQGDREGAIEHLHASREFAQEAKEAGLEAIVVSVLATHIGGHFREAMILGKDAIIKLLATSTDTTRIRG